MEISFSRLFIILVYFYYILTRSFSLLSRYENNFYEKSFLTQFRKHRQPAAWREIHKSFINSGRGGCGNDVKRVLINQFEPRSGLDCADRQTTIKLRLKLLIVQSVRLCVGTTPIYRGIHLLSRCLTFFLHLNIFLVALLPLSPSLAKQQYKRFRFFVFFFSPIKIKEVKRKTWSK
jgi:hypothetical protein